MSVRGKQNNDTCFCPESSWLLQSSNKVRPVQMWTSASTNNRGCLLHEWKHQRSQREFFFFFTKLRTRRDVHERYISLNCLLSVWFQSADSQVRRLSEQLCQKVEEVQKLQEDRGHLVELSQVSATHKDIHRGIQHGESTHWGVKVLKIFIQNKKKHLFLPVFYFIKTNWSMSLWLASLF